MCKQLFPKGTFRVAYKRGYKNLKELIAPSKISFRDSKEGSQEKRQYVGICQKCGTYQLGVGSKHQVSTVVKF